MGIRISLVLLLLWGTAPNTFQFAARAFTEHFQTELVRFEWRVGQHPEGGWTAGDRIPISLVATYPDDAALTLPDLPTAWGSFEVQDQRILEPAFNPDGTASVVLELHVTLWAPGDYTTPRLEAQYRSSDGTQSRSLAPRLGLSIASVLTTSDLEKRDLKPQASLSGPPWWPWLLAGLLILAVVGSTSLLGFKLLSKQKAAPVAWHVFSTRTSAHDTAYAELERITTLDLWSQGQLERHYALVAQCVRTYIEERYNINALEQTTEELSLALTETGLDPDQTGMITSLLAEVDLVKFAKHRPPRENAHNAIARAKNIIDVTKNSQPNSFLGTTGT